MNIKLIDTSHYFLTAPQAKRLAAGHVLPKHGYERQADRAELANVNLFMRARREGAQWQQITDLSAAQSHTAWVKRTPLSWWDGKTVEAGWVWCLHLHWA